MWNFTLRAPRYDLRAGLAKRRWQTPPLKIDKNIPDIAYGIVPDAFGWSRFPPIERKRSVMNR